ncbi:MAG: peptidase S10 [Cyanothece sp. SIO2G6]|nr:peptidase S10 [Cyanothece sp. SIO2G6]
MATLENSDSSSSRPTHVTQHLLHLAAGELHYRAIAAWQPLFDPIDPDKPVAEMFHVAYLQMGTEQLPASTPSPRPLTFVFNGGPGAASAYLHMGALGPQRLCFGPNGTLPPPPVQVVDNAETWLTFTDLVFVDPIGTGFSRSVQKDGGKAKAKGAQPVTKPDGSVVESPSSDNREPPELEFWEGDRDLQALGEFIQAFLSRHHRWRSPIFIAGESYGGFRVARLTHTLQKDFGIGLSGAILISPALEFGLLNATDYNLTTWATTLPSLAAAAAYHGKAEWAGASGDLTAQQAAAETFAYRTLLPFLAMGDSVTAEERQAVYQQLAQLLGLPVDLVERQGGRIGIAIFARELLRQERQVVGVYDASITAVDPFPGRDRYEGSDPTLDGIMRLFTRAINDHLRHTLGVETDLPYHLLSWTTFKSWKFQDKQSWGQQGYAGSVDSLRAGMTLNPYLKVYITHGIFDLITPYFASNHLVGLMQLPDEIRANLTLRHFPGGHMFYAWDESRRQWFADMQRFYGSDQASVSPT